MSNLPSEWRKISIFFRAAYTTENTAISGFIPNLWCKRPANIEQHDH
jgi:hypothetical protein